MSTKINGSDPAFPSESGGSKIGGYSSSVPCPTPGMTIRAHIATMMMPAIIEQIGEQERKKFTAEEVFEKTAIGAVRFADALIAELNKP